MYLKVLESDDIQTTIELLSLGDSYNFLLPLAPQLAMSFSSGKITLSKLMQLLVLPFLKLADRVDKAADQFSLEQEDDHKNSPLEAILLTRGRLMVACANGIRHVLKGDEVGDYVPPHMTAAKRAELTMARGDYVGVSEVYACLNVVMNTV